MSERIKHAIQWAASANGRRTALDAADNEREKKSARAKRYCKVRRMKDPSFRMLCNLRNRLRSALAQTAKASTTKGLLGCTAEELRAHLEAQFTPGMTWENYGEWHIDHIHPCAAYDLLDPEQQRACFHWSNLQPLWASENRKKRDRVT